MKSDRRAEEMIISALSLSLDLRDIPKMHDLEKKDFLTESRRAIENAPRVIKGLVNEIRDLRAEVTELKQKVKEWEDQSPYNPKNRSL